MGAKTYVIKCYKCRTRFEGPSVDAVIRDNGLKQDSRGYFCDCKVIVDIASEAKPEKKRKKEFDIKDFMA